MKFSMCYSKAVTIVMALFQRQHHLPFKQGYNSVRLFRRESAVHSDTAQSGRHKCRNQRAVYASHNVPSDTQFENTEFLLH
jgi:meiotically up-regulated gene 157 (Mug157) protein